MVNPIQLVGLNTPLGRDYLGNLGCISGGKYSKGTYI